eukprot:s2871_g8.t1
MRDVHSPALHIFVVTMPTRKTSLRKPSAEQQVEEILGAVRSAHAWHGEPLSVETDSALGWVWEAVFLQNLEGDGKRASLDGAFSETNALFRH